MVQSAFTRGIQVSTGKGGCQLRYCIRRVGLSVNRQPGCKLCLLFVAVLLLSAWSWSGSARPARGHAGTHGARAGRGQQRLRGRLASSFYGTAWNADGLSNIPVGYWQRGVDIRFRAPRSGVVHSVKLYFIYATSDDLAAQGSPDQCRPVECYGAGDGGRVKIELRSDDGTGAHRPSSAVLSETVLKHPMDRHRGAPSYGVGSGVGGRVTANFRVVKIPNAHLQKGGIYHLVFSNPAPVPHRNYVSLNSLYLRRPNRRLQPSVSGMDLALMARYSYAPGWHIRTHETPIFEVGYTDGFKFGQGYMGTGADKGIYGVNRVRERIEAVTGMTQKVSSLFIRIRRVGNPGPLRVRLERGGGSKLEEGRVQKGKVPGAYGWVRYRFRKVRTLVKGRKYNIVLAAHGDASNHYAIFPIQEGSLEYGFNTSNLFADGYAQVASGSGWQNDVPGWGGGSARAFDLQLYLATVSQLRESLRG